MIRNYSGVAGDAAVVGRDCGGHNSNRNLFNSVRFYEDFYRRDEISPP